MTPEQTGRWSRQLPLIGEEGQARLCAASARIEGDSPAQDVARLYLERAGVALADEGEPLPDVELPKAMAGEEPPLPELLGALAASAFMIQQLGVTT